MKNKLTKSLFILSLLSGSLVLETVPNNIKIVFAAKTINLVAVEGSDSYKPTQLVNGDFEKPVWQDYVYQGKTYTMTNLPESTDEIEVESIYNTEGWNTSETKTHKRTLFEYITNSETDLFYDIHHCRPTASYNSSLEKEFETGENKGCVEMNANNPSTFYQDLTTYENDIIIWTLDHAVRTKDKSSTPDSQTMKVEIGPTPYDSDNKIIVPYKTTSNIDSTKMTTYTSGGVTGLNGYYTEDGGVSSLKNLDLTIADNSEGWYNVSGVYAVPTSQSKTRFAFIATSERAYGNLLDNVSFSTLVGNLHAIKDEEGNVIVTGYWGEEDSSKSLIIDIGGTKVEVDMSSVSGKNFELTIDKSNVGTEKQIYVYHEDYEDAKVQVKIVHNHTWSYLANGNTLKAYCSNTVDTDGCKYQGSSSAISLSISASNATYDGSTYDGITFSDKTAWLKSGQDVPTVKYVGRGDTSYTESETAPTNAGKYSARIYGNSTTYASVDFEISALDITGKVTIVDIDDQKYTGEPITPALTIKYGETGNEKTLVKDTDYTVEYSNNTNVTTSALASIKFINNYSGTASKNFKIIQRTKDDITVTLKQDEFFYTGSAIVPELTVKYGEKTLTAGDTNDYTVVCSSNINAGTANCKIKLQNNYTGEIDKTFTIKPVNASSLEASLSDETLAYTGAELTPTVTVMFGTIKLTEGADKDYSVSYDKNIYAGTAEVTITYHGNYTGTKVLTFTISAIAAASLSVTMPNETYTYNGSAHTPKPVIKFGTKELTEGADKDYSLSYEKNIDAGTAKVNITYHGNYSGTDSREFTINPKASTTLTSSLDVYTYTYSGSENKPTITVKDGIKTLDLGSTKDYEVEYKNNINVGTGKVIAHLRGNYSGDVTEQFTISAAASSSVTMTMPTEDYYYAGEQIKPVPTLKFGETTLNEGEDKDYTLEYKNNINVTTSAEVIAHLRGNYSGDIKETFEIKPRNKSNVTVTLDKTEFDYSGKAIEPKVTVKDGLKTLDKGEDKDYTLTFENNIQATNQAKAIVTLCNNYDGVITEYFTIKQIGQDKITVTIPEATRVYNGSAYTPVPTVKYGQITLTETDEYTVSYNNNINASTNAEVIVTLCGSYTGSVTTYFTISPKSKDDQDISVTLNKTEFIYKGSAYTPEPVVKDGIKTLTKGDTDDYTLEYENNIAVGTGKVIVKFRGNYSGTVEKTFTIRKIAVSDGITVTMPNETYTYNGGEHKPLPTVKYNEATLTNETDYKLSYENNISVGEATVKITLQGNYDGTIEKNFTISPKDSSNNDLDATLPVTTFVYTGKEIEPEVNVTDKGSSLTLNEDYTLEYKDNIAVGSGSVKVVFKGNYSGSITRTFTIRKITMDDGVNVSLSQTTFIYNSFEHTPSPTVTYQDKPLSFDNDYELSYENNINIGEATLTVTFKGNYDGTKVLHFNIIKAESTNVEMTLDSYTFVYTGEEIKPIATLKLGDYVLIEGTDFTLNYENNIDAGTGNAVATLSGNFEGSLNKDFVINPKSIENIDVELPGDDETPYTGEEIEPDVNVNDGDTPLVEGIDYIIKYENNVEAGVATIRIIFIGNYSGEITKQFTILKPIDYIMIGMFSLLGLYVAYLLVKYFITRRRNVDGSFIASSAIMLAGSIVGVCLESTLIVWLAFSINIVAMFTSLMLFWFTRLSKY